MTSTWSAYYRMLLSSSKEHGNDVHDALVLDFLNNDEKYLNALLENHRMNFILVLSTKRGELHCIHHCSVYEDDLSGKQIVAGVHGTRFASNWKQLPLDKANIALKVPTKRKHGDILVPSLRQLIDVDSAS